MIATRKLLITKVTRIFGRRFHACLKRESQANPELADQLSDAELVSKVCRRERLTFYNFLRDHQSDSVLHTEEGLKSQLNQAVDQAAT